VTISSTTDCGRQRCSGFALALADDGFEEQERVRAVLQDIGTTGTGKGIGPLTMMMIGWCEQAGTFSRDATILLVFLKQDSGPVGHDSLRICRLDYHPLAALPPSINTVTVLDRLCHYFNFPKLAVHYSSTSA
jgi:hypothetical protein